MSSDVSGGLRLAPGTDPFAVLRSAMEAVKPIHRALVGAALAEEAADIVEKSDLCGTLVFRPLAHAAKELRSETLKTDWRGLNCRIAMANDPATGAVHLLVLGSREYLDTVKELEGVEDYRYWSSEAPDDLTEDEWHERRDVWDRILPGLGHVQNNMAVWNLDNDGFKITSAARADDFDAVEPHLPSVGERAVTLIGSRIFYQWTRSQPVDLGRAMELFDRLNDAKRLARSEGLAPVRELVTSLIAPTNWETFGEGHAVSLLHANLDRIDWMITRSIDGGATPLTAP